MTSGYCTLWCAPCPRCILYLYVHPLRRVPAHFLGTPACRGICYTSTCAHSGTYLYIPKCTRVPWAHSVAGCLVTLATYLAITCSTGDETSHYAPPDVTCTTLPLSIRHHPRLHDSLRAPHHHPLRRQLDIGGRTPPNSVTPLWLSLVRALIEWKLDGRCGWTIDGPICPLADATV